MDLDRLHEDVLTGLLSGDPAKAEATALRLYTEDAVFKHPTFIVEGRWRIARLWYVCGGGWMAGWTHAGGYCFAGMSTIALTPTHPTHPSGAGGCG